MKPKKLGRAAKASAACVSFFLLGALLFSSGCLVGPDYKPPKPALPEKWRQAADPAVKTSEKNIRDWWRVFNDPVMTSLIQRAAQGNLDLRAAVAKVKQARAQVGAASGSLVPALDGTGQASKQRTSEHSSPPSGTTTESYNLGLETSWEIDLFGRIRRSVEAAKADYQASEEDRVDVMITLYAEVASTYLDVRTTQARLASVRENIISQQRVLELTRSRFRNGLATALDVSQAETVLGSSEAEIPPLNTQLNQDINALALLLGLHPGALHEELRSPAPIPIPPASVTMGLPADLLRRRPDIRAAERSLAAETARIGVATADLYPSFSLTGSFGVAAGNTSGLLKSGSEFFTLGLPFSWNLFDGGRVRSQIKAQDAVAEQALLNYEQTVLAALNEVDNAYVAYTQQRIRVQALERTVAASERSLALAIKLYKDGLSDFQSVLDAQRTLFSYDDYYAAAKGEAASDLVLLYKALGGGWDASSRPHPASDSPRAPGSAEKKIQEAKK